jgi:hypothetical protein
MEITDFSSGYKSRAMPLGNALGIRQIAGPGYGHVPKIHGTGQQSEPPGPSKTQLAKEAAQAKKQAKGVSSFVYMK